MDTTGYRRFHFSTDDLPAHNRVEEVCELYGRTVVKLETRRRMKAMLLRDRRWCDCLIADIAAGAGFTDLSYFSRAFRRHYGATPLGYSRQG
jgi:AraC-like DNA-binding protein